MEAWSKNEPSIIDDEFVMRAGEFSRAVCSILASPELSMKVIIVGKVLHICDRSRKFASALSMSDIAKYMARALMGEELVGYPELRKEMLSLVMAMYEACESPKQMIAFARIDRIGQKLRRDVSNAVRPLAERLLRAVASNYVL
jgi:hypothetical protein